MLGGLIAGAGRVQATAGYVIRLATAQAVQGFVALDRSLNGGGQDLVALGHERGDFPETGPSRCPPTAVQIIQRIEWKIKHDDVIDLRYVQSASHQVRAYQNGRFQGRRIYPGLSKTAELIRSHG